MPQRLTQPKLSVVITTYNRRNLVVEALDSALSWLGLSADIEIVVVDDASNDGTLAHLRTRYSQEIALERMRLISLECNKGVTGARNSGVLAATGERILFLDSDDELLPNSQSVILDAIGANPERALIFFRSVLQGHSLIGPPLVGPSEVNIQKYLRHWVGIDGCMVFLRHVAMAIPFDEDLRGFEGLAWAKIIRRFGPMLVFGEAVKKVRYLEDGLSKSILSTRACLMVRGYARTFVQMGGDLGLIAGSLTLARIVFYAVSCVFADRRTGLSAFAGSQCLGRVTGPQVERARTSPLAHATRLTIPGASQNSRSAIKPAAENEVHGRDRSDLPNG